MSKKTIIRARLIIQSFVVSMILASCTSSEKVAFSPTSGFGGTGNRPSGFGGTGIVGTITKFGSIWVNGIEVEYDKKTQINSKLVSNDRLKIGTQVVFETLSNENETKTTKITIYYPIAGKITAVKEKQIIIDHKYTIKTSRAKFDKGLQIKVGKFIAINGFKVGTTTWVATRINKNPFSKSFYQGLPQLSFSPSIKQVLIESSSSQLKSWQKNIVADKQLSIQDERVILIGRFEKGTIRINAIEPYDSLPKSSAKEVMLKKYNFLINKALITERKTTNNSSKGVMKNPHKSWRDNESNDSGGNGSGGNGSGGNGSGGNGSGGNGSGGNGSGGNGSGGNGSGGNGSGGNGSGGNGSGGNGSGGNGSGGNGSGGNGSGGNGSGGNGSGGNGSGGNGSGGNGSGGNGSGGNGSGGNGSGGNGSGGNGSGGNGSGGNGSGGNGSGGNGSGGNGSGGNGSGGNGSGGNGSGGNGSGGHGK